jgi:hypothetical protein
MLLDGRVDASWQISVPHDPLTSTTEIALDLHKQLPKAKAPHESDALRWQSALMYGQIGELAYELCGSTTKGRDGGCGSGVANRRFASIPIERLLPRTTGAETGRVLRPPVPA